MPSLNFVGKNKVVNYHRQVSFRFLERQYGSSENMIIHGDNLLVLRSLLATHRGKIKCIYIDPPYNTGNENWIYNDNVNDPEIKTWIGKVVGDEETDLNRHDKWLCMMYPRLRLLQELLSDDAVIFISIDDNEVANLKLICDEIFGRNHFIDIFSWKKTETPANLSIKTKKAIEYILCYLKTSNSIKFRGLQKNSKSSNGLMNQTNAEKILIFPANVVDTALPDGIYSKNEYGTASYKIFLLEDTEVRDGFFIKPVKLQGKFKWSQENLDREISRGTKISIRTRAFSPSYEKTEYDPEVPWNLIDKSFGVKTNEQATSELRQIFDGEKVFDFPKPPSLISYLINFLCDSDSIILDAFAGSGTTAQAVVELNREDQGSRKFILIESMDYCESITAERVRRINGDFSFYELGDPIFIEDQLNPDLPRDQFRRYLFYSETKKEIPPMNPDELTLLGIHDGIAYHLIDGDLNFNSLAQIKTRAESYVIYAESCTISQETRDQFKIYFRKIPRDIRRI
ncbi:MAG: site-specific DNA-methyltransferase [Selenomonadaceae bacterium]|nr:site-specific DNA-methyltransferase [Selenomonadaceae bacterium]